MRKFEKLLQKIIDQSGLNLNNISQASGVSNGYLAKLARGKINRPGKDKITSILLVLNYTIGEINEILSSYDYQPLHEDDIPAILRNNRARRIIGGNLPQYDHIYFDLLLVALERIGGNKVMVKDRPSGVFMPHKLYLMKEYPYESTDTAAAFRYNLTKKILVERSQVFMKNIVSGSTTTTYICRDCLGDYLAKHLGPNSGKHSFKHADLVVRYFANALSLALKKPEQHRMYIMERCPYFHFLIQDVDGQTPKVSFPGRKLHQYDNIYDRRMLEGFTTDLPHIVNLFKAEIDLCGGAVAEHMKEGYPRSLYSTFIPLFEEFGMAEKLEEDLGWLMSQEEIIFY